MPLFDFKCEKCGHITEELVRKNSIPDEIKCGSCGEKAKRIFSAGAGKQCGESRSIWSKAFGINPDQIPAMMKRFPNDVYRPRDGAMRIDGYQHQKKVAKRLGMVID